MLSFSLNLNDCIDGKLWRMYVVFFSLKIINLPNSPLNIKSHHIHTINLKQFFIPFSLRTFFHSHVAIGNGQV